MVKSNNDSNSNNLDLYNIIVLIVDFIILIAKFYYTIIESIIKAFIKKESVSVSGQTVLITGAGHGIGKELALKYGSLGATVICWDINEKNNQQTAKEVKSAGGQSFAYTCNVMIRDDINALANEIKSKHGFINIIVNNAGIMPCHPILQHTESEIRSMFEINVIAHFWIIQAFLPDMIERNEGTIVALSSCAGLFGLPNLVPYCGTKYAVRGYMEALREELRRDNPKTKIQLTTIYPYMVDTGLCKKPRYRFPSLMKLVPPKDAAASIVEAQTTGLEDASIPRHFLYLDRFGRAIPKDALRLVNDFLDTGVDSDL